MSVQPPLILTLQLDAESFVFFNALRQQHFPEKINYLDAHLTMFHHLPNTPLITDLLEKVTAQQRVIPLKVANVIKLGRGVAYKIESPALMQLQQNLKTQWQPWLTPQDQQGFRPHITVQNKVEVQTANVLFEELSSTFQPFTAAGIGLSLWEYQGGPWQKKQDYSFQEGS